MKLSQNSVSAVLFSTKEGKRNGNDPKAPMNPDAPEKRKLGFCILSGDQQEAVGSVNQTGDGKWGKTVPRRQRIEPPDFHRQIPSITHQRRGSIIE